MKRKLSERLVITTFFSLFTLCIVSFFKTQTAYSATTHLVISEVQISGSTTTDEFVELYNPTDININLSGWKLLKKTASSGATASVMATMPTGSEIKAHGYYLIAHTNYDGLVQEDLTYENDQYSTNNTVILQNASDNVIDKVGMGNAADFEGNDTEQTSVPATDRSIERKALQISTAQSMSAGDSDELLGNGYDSDNNKDDFVYKSLIQGTNPQNSFSSIEPPVNTSPTPTGESSPTQSLSPTPTTSPAPSEATVVINEIAWSGTEANSNHEWIELYNTTGSPVDLTDWTLKAVDETPDITLSGSIAGHEYYLLERTTEETVSDIVADLIYTGALGDTGESLELRNSEDELIDTANTDGGGWPAGDSSERKSMERKDSNLADTDNNWITNDGVTKNGVDQDGNNIQGTPKAQNSSGEQVIAPTPTPTSTISITPTQSPTVTPTQKPTSTVTPIPTLLPTPTPTPSPTPTSAEKIVATFSFPGRTVTCSLSFKIRVTRFFIMLIPKISCR